MTGKTHAAVGLGTVLAVTQPSTVSGLVLAAGTGMLGALISDIVAIFPSGRRSAMTNPWHR